MQKFMFKAKLGFSLMEVMVALAILAMSFSALVLVQSRATRLAVQSRHISIATQLARFKLMECKREAQKKIATVSDFKIDGDFSDLGYEDYKWECHAPKFNMKTPSASKLEERAKSQAPEGAKDKMGATSSTMSPMLSIITESLGDSVRELVVIVRWSKDNVEDELRVATHVVDLNAMSALSKMLKQGADSLIKSSQTKDEKDKGVSPSGTGGSGE